MFSFFKKKTSDPLEWEAEHLVLAAQTWAVVSQCAIAHFPFLLKEKPSHRDWEFFATAAGVGIELVSLDLAKPPNQMQLGEVVIKHCGGGSRLSREIQDCMGSFVHDVGHALEKNPQRDPQWQQEQFNLAVGSWFLKKFLGRPLDSVELAAAPVMGKLFRTPFTQWWVSGPRPLKFWLIGYDHTGRNPSSEEAREQLIGLANGVLSERASAS